MNFHDFEVVDIAGKAVKMDKYKGKKVLVVNVASKCGLTSQYENLQKLYDDFGGAEFEIVGFPSNNFLGQEPGSNKEIETFCSLNYQVSFPLMSKISVKGKDQAEIYKWLTKGELNEVVDAPVKWNFQKFLIGEEGQWLTYFSPKTDPLSEEIVNWLN